MDQAFALNNSAALKLPSALWLVHIFSQLNCNSFSVVYPLCNICSVVYSLFFSDLSLVQCQCYRLSVAHFLCHTFSVVYTLY